MRRNIIVKRETPCFAALGVRLSVAGSTAAVSQRANEDINVSGQEEEQGKTGSDEPGRILRWGHTRGEGCHRGHRPAAGIGVHRASGHHRHSHLLVGSAGRRQGWPERCAAGDRRSLQ